MAENLAEPETPIKICSVCLSEESARNKICKACDKCVQCRNHYRCRNKHKKIRFHCPDFKVQCTSCHACAKTCKCWTCKGCNNKISLNAAIVASNDRTHLRCKRKSCGKCYRCCTCIKCVACFKVFESRESAGYCSTCNMCENECRCPAVSWTNENRINFKASKGFKLNPIKRFISAEIEVSGCQQKNPKAVDKTIKEWGAVVKRDGSLPPGGFEINTSPANGDEWVKQVADICAALEIQKGFVTNVAGLHVHVDARDYDYLDLRRLAILYSHVEEQLYSLVDNGRKTSTYCRPCGKYYLKHLVNLEGGTKDSRVRSIEAIIRGVGDGYSGERYHGLNLHAYFVHKTIECRMHQGTIDPESITRWGMLWGGILEYAKNHSDLEVSSLKMTGWELLLEMAPTKDIHDWLSSKTDASIKKSKVEPQVA